MESSLHKKLVAVQQALRVPKTEQGRFGKHRNVEGILTAVKPQLEKQGLTLIMDNEAVLVGERIYVKAVATISDGNAQITATGYAWEGDISRGLDAPQVTGAASSYARKCALGGLFAIDDTKDPDSHKDAPEPAKKTVAIQKDSDPVTPQQKQHLKNMMTALEMDADAMGYLVESTLEKQTVETFGDYNKVLATLEETK